MSNLHAHPFTLAIKQYTLQVAHSLAIRGNAATISSNPCERRVGIGERLAQAAGFHIFMRFFYCGFHAFLPPLFASLTHQSKLY
jgi:hypothetical protein